MGEERCDCQRRRLKAMKEPEGHVKDIGFLLSTMGSHQGTLGLFGERDPST